MKPLLIAATLIIDRSMNNLALASQVQNSTDCCTMYKDFLSHPFEECLVGGRGFKETMQALVEDAAAACHLQ